MRSYSVFRIGDKVTDRQGNHIWNITRVEGNKFWYDVLYNDRPNSPNVSDMIYWDKFVSQYGWKLVERVQLPEELFSV